MAIQRYWPAIFAILAACTSISNEPEPAATSDFVPANSSSPNLQILLHDRPGPDVEEVWVDIERVEVHATSGDWIEVSADVEPVDLLRLQDGVTKELGLDRVGPGAYDQIRFFVSDSWVISGGDRADLLIPSGAQTGLKVQGEFEVPVRGRVIASVDWDVGAHLHFAPGKGWTLRPTLKVAFESRGAVTGVDADGDGAPDVFAAARYDATSVADILGYASGGGFSDYDWRFTAQFSVANWPSSGAHLGDLDGDGDSEFVVSGFVTAPPLSIYHGSATGPELVPSELIEAPEGLVPGELGQFGRFHTTGDFNGDGRVDLVARGLNKARTDAGVFVYLGLPDGSFEDSPSSVITKQSISFGELPPIQTGDVDGDGYDDVVVSERLGAGQTGRIWIYAGPQIDSAPTWELSGDCGRCRFGSSFAIVDANADGFDDILASSPFDGGLVHYFPGSASGPPATPAETSSFGPARDFGRTLVPIGDFNGDGFEDIAAASRFDDAVLILGGSPSGPTGLGTVRAAGYTYHHPPLPVGVGDLNADGFDDVAVSHRVYDGDGDGVEEGAVWIYFGDDDQGDRETADVVLGASDGPTNLGLIPGLGHNPRIEVIRAR